MVRHPWNTGRAEYRWAGIGLQLRIQVAQDCRRTLLNGSVRVTASVLRRHGKRQAGMTTKRALIVRLTSEELRQIAVEFSEDWVAKYCFAAVSQLWRGCCTMYGLGLNDLSLSRSVAYVGQAARSRRNICNSFGKNVGVVVAESLAPAERRGRCADGGHALSLSAPSA